MLNSNEDAPMCLSVNPSKTLQSHLVCGINAPADEMKQGKNPHVRVFEFSVHEHPAARTEAQMGQA